MITVIDDNLAVFRFPYRKMGIEIGRTVTLIRLNSGDVVVHSTAPMSRAQVREINEFGRPIAVVEATKFHDTFAHYVPATFPDLPYFVPNGFSMASGVEMEPLSDAFDQWPELEIVELEGAPMIKEHVFFHRPSGTLITADLLFNFGPRSPAATRGFFRWVAGIRRSPGMSRFFRVMIRDREAFRESMRSVMRLDFDRIITGHGDVVESGAKAKLRQALPEWAI